MSPVKGVQTRMVVVREERNRLRGKSLDLRPFPGVRFLDVTVPALRPTRYGVVDLVVLITRLCAIPSE